MTAGEVAIAPVDAAGFGAALPALADILHASVLAGASVNFVLPFRPAEAEAYFLEKVLPPLAAGTRTLLVARAGGAIVGTVQLDADTPPNQPHRAEVTKLLVHPNARRRGIGRALMAAAETAARAAGRTLLTLDTRTGDAAEPLYASLGYVTVGRIPGYCVAPSGQGLDSTTIMYKTL